MKGSGIIFKTDDGKYAIAYQKEQHQSFANIRKMFVHLFEDELCMKPLTDESGKKIVSLKSIDKLKQIGFVD